MWYHYSILWLKPNTLSDTIILQKDAATLRFATLLLFLHSWTCHICSRIIRNYIPTSEYVGSILRPSVLSCPSQVYALRDTLLAAVKAAWDGQRWWIRSAAAAVLFQPNDLCGASVHVHHILILCLITTTKRSCSKTGPHHTETTIGYSNKEVDATASDIKDLSSEKLADFCKDEGISDMRAMLLNSEVCIDRMHLAQDSWYVGWQFILS